MSEEIQYSAKEEELKSLCAKSMQQNKKRYYVPNENDELTTTFNSCLKAINEYDLLNKHNVKFSLHYVYPNISKRTWAHIMKTSPQLKMYSGIDIVVEVSGEVWELLDQEQKNILIEHELMHLYPIENDEGVLKLKLAQHDLQDFKKIISKYGIEWTQKCDAIKSQLAEVAAEKKLKEKENNPNKRRGRPRTRFTNLS